MREETIKAIEREKIIVVLRGLTEEETLRTAEALFAGGIRLVEYAFDQTKKDPAEDEKILSSLVSAMRGKMIVGAGTVTTEERLEAALAAGAEYIIAPNTNEDVVRLTRRAGAVSIPGALTPTEIVRAYEAGADFVKVFPAGAMGPGYIKDVATPFPGIPLLAVAGVTQDNVRAFLDAGAVGVGISSAIANRAWIRSGDYEKVTEAAKAFVALVG